MSNAADRFGLPGWLVLGTLFGVGAYAAFLLVALLDPQPDNLAALVVAPVLVLLTVPIATRLARNDDDPGLLLLLLIAAALKLAASLLRYYVAIDLYGGLADAAGYHEAGSLFVDNFRALDFSVATGKIPGTGFIEVVTGVVYSIAGVSRLTGFFVFAWLGFLGQVLCWRAFKLAVPDGDSKRYALLILFLPTLLYWPSSIGKEGWMLLTIGLTVYGLARLLRHLPFGITLTALGILGVTMVRPHVALILLASALAALLVGRSRARSPLTPVLRLASIAAVLTITLVVVSQAAGFLGVESLDQETVATTLSNTEIQTGQGGSQFTPVPVNTPLDLPAATGTVLFRPFPFEADNAQTFATAVEGLFLLALCAASWRRFAAIPRLVRSTPYVAFALVFVLLFVYAFSSFSNFGLLARQRTQVLPFLLVLLALPPFRARLPVRRAADDAPAESSRTTPRRFDRWTQPRAPRLA
jgi:hypothetical protein